MSQLPTKYQDDQDNLVAEAPAASTAPLWGSRTLSQGLLLVVVISALALVRFLAAPVGGAAAAAEDITFDQFSFPAPGTVDVALTNTTEDDITIAQVQFDVNYRAFSVSPSATIPAHGHATLTVPFPWDEGTSYPIIVMTSDGGLIESATPDAALDAAPDASLGLRYDTIALYLAIVPLALGLFGFALLRRMGRREAWTVAALASGALLFLLVQTLGASLDTVSQATGVFGGASLVFLAVVLTILVLLVPQISRGRPAGRGHHTARQAVDDVAQQAEGTKGTAAPGGRIVVGRRNLALGLAIGASINTLGQVTGMLSGVWLIVLPVALTLLALLLPQIPRPRLRRILFGAARPAADEVVEEAEEAEGAAGTPPASVGVFGASVGAGLRNLALGLAIGTAFALGNTPLGAFLVVGFALHALVGSHGVFSPLVEQRPSIWRVLGLGLMMGLPAAGGLWLGVTVGADLYAQFATALFLAVGGGALAYTIYDIAVARLFVGQSRDAQRPALTPATLAAVAAGVGAMCLVGLLLV